MSRCLIATYCVISLINIGIGEYFPESSDTTISEEKGKDLEQSTDFTELEEDTFYNYTENGNHFVKFFVPWCAHSERLEPTWKKLADSPEFEEKLKFSRVDCEANRKLCDNYDVEGYPTLTWIENGKKVKKYAGGRDYQSISSFIHKMLHQEKVTS